jgi:hypothetical protein
MTAPEASSVHTAAEAILYQLFNQQIHPCTHPILKAANRFLETVKCALTADLYCCNIINQQRI